MSGQAKWMENGSSLAYPGSRIEDMPEHHSADYTVSGRVTHAGLTKRELFAAMAMQGMCARQCVGTSADATEGQWHEWVEGLTQDARAMADAMLAELAKEKAA